MVVGIAIQDEMAHMTTDPLTVVGAAAVAMATEVIAAQEASLVAIVSR